MWQGLRNSIIMWNVIYADDSKILAKRAGFKTVKVNARMSLHNGLWRDLRNGIIMRNVLYAE